MTQSEMDNKQEFVILLDLLSRVNDAIEGSSISDASERERLIDAHNLANKFIGHALTILYLSHGTVIQDLPSFKKLNFSDSASIDVLSRAAMEAFLVFHYVFYAPETKEGKDYRHWTYKAAGIAERQNLPESTLEHVQQKAEDNIELDKLRTKLESNMVFQDLTAKQKIRFFQGKEKDLWRWNLDVRKVLPWRAIAIDAGFSDMLASHIYRHLSGYAHSSSLSVLQMAQALVNKESEKLIEPSINLMKILTANMIQEYSGLFSKAQDVLDGSGASQFVSTWVEVGRRLDEGLNMVGNND